MLCTTGLPELTWPPSAADLEVAGARLRALPLASLLRTPSASAASTTPPGACAQAGCAWPSVDLKASLLDVVGAFVHSHSQHLLVLGPGREVVSVVSQSDIVRWGYGAGFGGVAGLPRSIGAPCDLPPS
jgi:hypothetical protein